MIKSTTTAQELRLVRPQHHMHNNHNNQTNHNNNNSASTETMEEDPLKTSFIPDLCMETGGVISNTPQFCPICGQQFERAQHAAEHMQLCHGIITNNIGGLSGNAGILMPSPPQTSNVDSLKIDYPCLSCDDKFSSGQELDEHHRLIHQTAAYVARCMACGIYGISSAALQEGDQYKCMHCGAVCTAAALSTSSQASFLDQPQLQQTSDDEEQRRQQEVEHVQRIVHQQQTQEEAQQEEVQLKVPPLTVKLNKGSGTVITPQVVIKQEPLGDSGGDTTPTSVPVYTIQQNATAATSTATSVVVSPASLRNQEGTTVIIGNKIRHKCPECPKTFKTPSTLAMHRKIHSGEADTTPKERPYTCSYCGKSFTQSNTLKQHTRIHTGEKPFNCAYCEKAFSVKDYLTKHIRTHTGEKPYTCPYCDKRFTQRSALTVHTTKLHPL